MVHILFDPLELVVNASHDPVTGLPSFAGSIMLPLLSPEAVQLLAIVSHRETVRSGCFLFQADCQEWHLCLVK